ALERGVIDATEFSMPNMDINLGFHQIAKYNYYPGWHQQVSVNELLMNKDAWEALDDQNQAILEAACGWNNYTNYAETEAKNPAAMNTMLAEHGVTNVRWTDEELAAFEAAWIEVLEEQSAQDEDFKKIADSYLAFRKVYKTWGDAQQLDATYLSGD
ncbi:MAG: C4-dicarboxylate ABC transporter, partial [Geminicoccaceae bacterium]